MIGLRLSVRWEDIPAGTTCSHENCDYLARVTYFLEEKDVWTFCCRLHAIQLLSRVINEILKVDYKA